MSAAQESLLHQATDAPPVGSLVPQDKDKPEDNDQKIVEERRQAFKPLLEYLRNTCDAVDSLEKSERLDIFRTQVKSHKFYAGKQVGVVDAYGKWQDTSRPEDQIYIDPQYQYHVDTALVEVGRSKTELRCEGVEPDDPVSKALGEYAQKRIDFHRNRLFQPSFALREGLFLILSGTALRYTYFTTDCEGEFELIPKSEPKEVPGLSTQVCAYCSMPAKDGEPCPNCRGQKTKEISAPTIQRNVVTSWQKVSAGECVAESVDPAEINVSLRARKLKDSPYLHRRRLVMRALLEEKYKQIIPTTGIKDERLRLQRGLELDTNKVGDDSKDSDSEVVSGGEQFELVEFDQVWLKPSLYFSYELPEPAKLPNGKVLPKGFRLIKMFPNGLYIAKVGDKILDLRNEDFTKLWTGTPFRLKPTSFYGGGFENLIPLQEQANNLRSLQFVDVGYNSVRREAINTQSGISADDISNDPSKVIEFDSLDMATPISNVYFQASAQTSLAQTIPLKQELAGDMQSSAGTFGSQGNMADVKLMGTATGAAIMRQMQTNRYSAALWLRSEADVEQAYQLLELEQKNYSQQRFEKLKGRYGAKGVEAFRKCNVRADIRIEAVPGSWMPDTRAERIANHQAFAQLLSAAQRPITDDILALFAEDFRVPYSAAEYSLAERIVSENLEKFTAYTSFFESQGMGDPALAQVVLEQSGVSVDIFLDDHQSLISEYKDWKMSDQGRSASPLLIATVDEEVKRRFQAIKEFEKYMAALSTEAEAPVEAGKLIAEGARMEAKQLTAGQAQEQQAPVALQEQELKQADREHEAQTQMAIKEHEASLQQDTGEKV